MLSELVALAWLIWGVGSHPTIVEDQDLPSGYYAMATQGLLNGECRIWIDSTFYENTYDQQLGIIIHEIGHCLGLDHVPYPSVMNGPTYWTRPTESDYIRLRQITRPFSIFISL